MSQLSLALHSEDHDKVVQVNKAILCMDVGLFLLNVVDWNKNPHGIIPVSTVKNVHPHLWIATF